MLEADIVEGDLGQITQAIQNALRPAQPQVRVVQQRISAGALPEPEIAPEDELEEEDLMPAPAQPARPARAPTKRTYRTPEVVDVDLDTNLSFANFAGSRSPDSIKDKYLIVAAWFKLHRQISAITADHVYTCSRKIGWSVNIKDFTKPLQNLKFDKLLGGDASGFTINHLGLDRVDKMKKDG